MPFVMENLKFNKELLYQMNLPYFTEVLLNISDTSFVQNKDYQYLKKF